MRADKRDRRGAIALSSGALAAFAGLLALVQGGFYALPTCAAGAVMALAALVVLLFRHEPGELPSSAALLAAVGFVSLASAWANGPTLTMVGRASCWFAIAACGLVAALAPRSARSVVLEAVCWTGVALAFMAAVDFAAGSYFHPARVSLRLEFPFQYANASGIWFAVIAVLCAYSGKWRLAVCACIPMTVLLATRSVGAIAVFGLAFALLEFRSCKAGRTAEALCGVASLLVSVLAFAASLAAGAWCALVGMPLGIAACAAIGRRRDGLERRVSRLGPMTRWLPFIASLVMFALLVGVAALALPERLGQAGQTLIERLVQIGDGLGLLASGPLLGIGPDAWSWTYPFAQSAQYQAGAIHCGYLQIALDSGLLGLAAFIAFSILGAVRLAKAGDTVSLVASCMLLAHALLDFDFSFAAILALLVILMAVPGSGERSGDDAPLRKGASIQAGSSERSGGAGSANAILGNAALSAALGVSCLLVCAGGVVAASVVSTAYDAGIAGDLGTVESVAEGSSLAAGDVSVRTSLCAARLQAGDVSAIAGYAGSGGVQSAEQALLCAAALFQAGDDALAGAVLVDEIEREPYNVELFGQAALQFDRYSVDPQVGERYRQAVERANALAREGNAVLLSNQVDDLPIASVLDR